MRSGGGSFGGGGGFSGASFGGFRGGSLHTPFAGLGLIRLYPSSRVMSFGNANLGANNDSFQGPQKFDAVTAPTSRATTLIQKIMDILTAHSHQKKHHPHHKKNDIYFGSSSPCTYPVELFKYWDELFEEYKKKKKKDDKE